MALIFSLIYILSTGAQNYLSIYASLNLIALSLVIANCCNLNFRLLKSTYAFSQIEGSLFRSIPVYLNNTAISLLQMLLLGLLSWSTVEVLSQYRVLQSIQALVAVVPILAGFS